MGGQMKGSVLGASFLATGTAIGAGMLAIPLITGELGFLLSSLLLIVCWGATIIAALLLLHVNMVYSEGANLSTMAKKAIGTPGSAITWCAYLLLLYSLIAAYMMGGAALLGNTLLSTFHIEPPPFLNASVFTVILGAFVYFGTRSVDYINRVLLGLKLGAFFLMIALLLPHIQFDALIPTPSNPKRWLIALPVLITSYGYQIVIPNLRDYLHSNISKIKRAIWIGGTIPLVIYLLWVAIIFGLLPDLSGHDDLSSMVSSLESRVKIPFIGGIISFFTDIALTTSFLGVSMSLFHFIRDGFRLNRNRFREKGLALLITFAPPFCFSLVYPKSFLEALSYGGIFVVILLMIIPVWMALSIKRKKIKSAFSFKLHWTGLWLILGISVLTIGSQLIYHR